MNSMDVPSNFMVLMALMYFLVRENGGVKEIAFLRGSAHRVTAVTRLHCTPNYFKRDLSVMKWPYKLGVWIPAKAGMTIGSGVLLRGLFLFGMQQFLAEAHAGHGIVEPVVGPDVAADLFV